MTDTQPTTPRFDVDGYLLDANEWSRELALELATDAGLKELTDEHWRIVMLLRERYVEGDPDMFPQVRHLCAELGMSDDCISRHFGDPIVAWRVAGLPKAGIDMSAYIPDSDRT